MKLYAIIRGEAGTNIETCLSVWSTKEKAEHELLTLPKDEVKPVRIVEFEADAHNGLEAAL